MKVIFAAAALAAVAVTAGCTPEQMETTPVVVQTAQGPVTCQLYTLRQVMWDRAIGHPNGMDVKTADAACRAEGYRILNGGRAAAPTAVVAAPAGSTVVVDAGL